MSSNRGSNTRIELVLRSALHKRGLRFRLHPRHLPGRPDIVFTRSQIAVFVDGDFWHGYDLDTWRHKLSPSWLQKIEKNRARDQRVDSELALLGWEVVRVWEHEMRSDLAAVVGRILTLNNARRKGRLSGS